MSERVVYTVPQFCETFQTGKTRAYEEIKTGRLPIVKVGRKTLIRHDAAIRWLEQCERNATTSNIAG
ncbi:MAG: helix-turn-helix domain-containing protein [Gemmatimonadales bacterium]|nr:helix-turn-helix domain-containing protein [Gemmatimonadales bacterium]